MIKKQHHAISLLLMSLLGRLGGRRKCKLMLLTELPANAERRSERGKKWLDESIAETRIDLRFFDTSVCLQNSDPGEEV